MGEKTIADMSWEEMLRAKSGSAWGNSEAVSDAPVDEDAQSDWTTAELVTPEPKKMISVRLDADVLDYFRSQGSGYQTRMNAVLRSYMSAKKNTG